jgi:predicted GIY-YIG superfamily endonuclease
MEIEPDKNYCYLLRHTNPKYKNLTYGGFTTDPIKRIKRHNGEISGGAKYTTSRNNCKGKWYFCLLITGFLTRTNALNFEWIFNHYTRRKKYLKNNVEGRIRSLNEILQFKRWTKNADIDNDTCEYRIYVTHEMIQFFDFNVIPNNFSIFSMEVLDSKICL